MSRPGPKRPLAVRKRANLVERWCRRAEAGHDIRGQGRAKWGECIARLRRIVHDGVLSIKHHDGFISADEGVFLGERGLEHLL